MGLNESPALVPSFLPSLKVGKNINKNKKWISFTEIPTQKLTTNRFFDPKKLKSPFVDFLNFLLY
jgi:hypothetical protein